MGQAIEIVSSNLDIDNKNAGENLARVLASNPDIACLQEVSEPLLQKIEHNDDYESFFALDFVKDGEYSFLAILVRKNIAVESCLEKPHSNQTNKWVGQRLGYSWNMCQHSLSVKVRANKSNPISIATCHLDVTSSIDQRYQTLRDIHSAHLADNDHVILCGDMNNFGSPLKNLIFGWGFGIKPDEFSKDERIIFNHFLEEHGLLRAFPEDTITHAPLRVPVLFRKCMEYMIGNCIDHVVFRGMKLLDKKLLPENGSDHKGLSVTLTT